MEGEVFLDPIEFMRDLGQRQLPYLLVGRQALILLGAPVLSADYDFYFSPEQEDLRELLALARSRGLEVSTGEPDKRPFFSILSDTLKLDFFRCRAYTTKDGETFTFADVYARRRSVRVEDVTIDIPSIDDLIRIKKVRDLPRDREDIKYLQLLAERERGDLRE